MGPNQTTHPHLDISQIKPFLGEGGTSLISKNATITKFKKNDDDDDDGSESNDDDDDMKILYKKKKASGLLTFQQGLFLILHLE